MLFSKNILSRISESINDGTVSHELLHPSNSHPMVISFTQQPSQNAELDLHAPLRICEVLVIANEMLLIPRVLLHALVVLETLEDDLTEAVEVRNIGHLRVEELRH